MMIAQGPIRREVQSRRRRGDRDSPHRSVPDFDERLGIGVALRIKAADTCPSRVWEYDHKEAPLRVPTERQGAPTNVELKACDASANPYLSLAGLIAAGLDGIERGLDLPPPIDFDPGTLSDAEGAARGIERLPQTLDAALAALAGDPVLLAALGGELARAYLAVKRAGYAELSGLALADEVGRLVEAY
jgi:glutamine synthetase